MSWQESVRPTSIQYCPMLTQHEHRVHGHQATRSVMREKITEKCSFPAFVRGCRSDAQARPRQWARIVYSGSLQVHITQQHPVMTVHAYVALANRPKFPPFFSNNVSIFQHHRNFWYFYRRESNNCWSEILRQGSILSYSCNRIVAVHNIDTGQSRIELNQNFDLQTSIQFSSFIRKHRHREGYSWLLHCQRQHTVGHTNRCSSPSELHFPSYCESICARCIFQNTPFHDSNSIPTSSINIINGGLNAICIYLLYTQLLTLWWQLKYNSITQELLSRVWKCWEIQLPSLSECDNCENWHAMQPLSYLIVTSLRYWLIHMLYVLLFVWVSYSANSKTWNSQKSCRRRRVNSNCV